MAAQKRAKKGSVEFNHAMIYTSKLARALRFYRDALGFRVVDEYPGAYTRMKSPRGGTMIALHVLDRGQRLDTKTEGLRLYFEVGKLDSFCSALNEEGGQVQPDA